MIDIPQKLVNVTGGPIKKGFAVHLEYIVPRDVGQPVVYFFNENSGKQIMLIFPDTPNTGDNFDPIKSELGKATWAEPSFLNRITGVELDLHTGRCALWLKDHILLCKERLTDEELVHLSESNLAA